MTSFIITMLRPSVCQGRPLLVIIGAAACRMRESPLEDETPDTERLTVHPHRTVLPQFNHRLPSAPSGTSHMSVQREIKWRASVSSELLDSVDADGMVRDYYRLDGARIWGGGTGFCPKT